MPLNMADLPSASGVPSSMLNQIPNVAAEAVAISEISPRNSDTNISRASTCSLSTTGSTISVEQTRFTINTNAATADEVPNCNYVCGNVLAESEGNAKERLRLLEDEHDALNSSLISISTQFAQVQFRLKQLSATTSAEEREALLRELEHVAFEGCPDLYGATQLLREEKQQSSTYLSTSEQKQLLSNKPEVDEAALSSDDDDDDELLTGVNNHRSKSLGSARSQSRSKKNQPETLNCSANSSVNAVQPSKSGDSVNSDGVNSVPTLEDDRRRLEMVEVINKLRKQVEDLESLAYQQGHMDAPPSKLILERQREVIDQLRSRLNIKVGEGFEKLTKAELRSRLDAAIGSVMIPMKEKEIMLEQLLHQVKDLERFIEFLQCESNPQTKQPSSAENFAVLSRKSEQTLPNRGKGVRLQRQTTSEFDLQNKDAVLSSNSSTPELNYQSNMKRNAWIDTFAAKSHAVLHVLSYMLICGSREQQQQANFFAAAAAVNDNRRDSLPFDCATPSTAASVDAPVFSTFQNRSAMFRSNQLKATPAGSHYGDERAVFELAIGHMREILERRENLEHVVKQSNDSSNYYGGDEHYSSDSDEEALVNDHQHSSSVDARKSSSYLALVRCVRREFAPALMALMRHGYAPDRLQRATGLLRNAVMLLPGAAFACVPSISMKLPSLGRLGGGARGSKSVHNLSSLANTDTHHAHANANMTLHQKGGDGDAVTKKLHPWHLVLQFYNMKDGAAYNRSASKKLADAFALPSAASGARAVTSRETLLATIGEIIETHGKLKRSLNSYFKAFVCAGLNGRVLSAWLRLIYGTDKLIEANYEPWSYAVRTHFSDALASIDQLIIYDFNLPVDFAVRRLQNLNDAF